MEDNNYIVIQGWMVNRLGLTGNHLMVYAIIYGFSQDGDSRFQGTRKYIAESIGKTMKTVDNILNDLVEKEYIVKHKREVSSLVIYDYEINRDVVNFARGEKISLGAKKFPKGSEKNSTGGEKISLGSEKISPHNIIDNNKDNIIDNIKEINKEKKRFVKPTLEDVKAYCQEKGYTWDPEAFYSYHESRGWIVGKAPMKNWHAAMSTWDINSKKWNNNSNNNGDEQRETTRDKKYSKLV